MLKVCLFVQMTKCAEENFITESNASWVFAIIAFPHTAH